MNDITMWHLKIAARQLGGLLQESRMKAHLSLEEASAITKHGREKRETKNGGGECRPRCHHNAIKINASA